MAPAFEGALEHAVHVLDVELIVTAVPPIAFGLRIPMSGYSSASMITESPILHLGVADLAVGRRHAHPLGRAEDLAVEVDRGVGAVDDRYGVIRG